MSAHRETQLAVRECLGPLLKGGDGTFSFRDLCRGLGPPFAMVGPDQHRARHILYGLVSSRVLKQVARGTFAAGDVPMDGVDHGRGLALHDDVFRALQDAGGFAKRTELERLCGARDASGRRLMTEVLRADDRFLTGLEIRGRAATYFLRDDLRIRSPLHGRWARLEVQLGAGGDDRRATWTAGMERSLLLHRRRIGLALAQARKMAGLDVADVACSSDLQAAFAKCLYDGGAEIAEWIAATVREIGKVDALTVAWDALETADDGDISIAETLSVAFWRSAGALFRADAAALSRGGVFTPVISSFGMEGIR